MTPKWTPGPLRVSRVNRGDGEDVFVEDERGNIVARMGRDNFEEAKDANAARFAAAPDLYEALKEIGEALDGARAANPEASIEFFEELVEIEPGWRQRIRLALAKARGESPDARP